MIRIALFFADGRGFFLGTCLLVLGVLVSMKYSRSWLARLAVLAGVALVVVSATPLPYWFYGAWLTTVGLWTVLNACRTAAKRHRVSASVLALAASVAALVLELPYHRMPHFKLGTSVPVVVIGDSISAGMRRGETTWPQVLRDQLGYQVLDLSQAGATVASAMTQAARIPSPSVVLIEIGGNDLLGNTSCGEFESGLRKLLDRVHGAGRQVFMFELPLLPFRNEYGRIQRRLAEEYGAVLIPKRVLAGAIGLRGGTLDGLHLSDEGHQSIARSVSSIHGT